MLGLVLIGRDHLTRLRRITNFAGLRTARIELACRTDFRRCHPARDVAHLLADVVVPSAGRESSELSAQARDTLQAFFDLAQQRPDQNLRIEGNCDERGTREYNLALGQRRADAAKTYLLNLGLEPSRITTISYGEERPRAPGHDKAAWRQNRRDDLMAVTAAVSEAR